MANPRTIKITELPASTQDLNETDRLVAVQPFGSALLTVQLPASKILDAARTAGAGAASSSGLVFATVSDAQSSHLLPGKSDGTALSTTGYAVIGDGGAATYEKVATEPSHAGKFQDTVGAWWELKVVEVRPEMFGAKGDGVTDDTESMQNALDYLENDGSLLLRNGGIYAVTNLTYPGRISITANGRANIVALAGGDSRYLMTTLGWLTNSIYGGAPIRFSNVVFDGANIKDYSLIVDSYDSTFNEIECRGGNVAGMYISDIGENGINRGIGMGGMRINECMFRLNNGDGLHSKGQTDFIFTNSKSHTNGGWGWWFDGMGGGQLHHLYGFGNTLGQAYFNKYGLATIVADCEWDGEVLLSNIYNDVTGSHVYGPGNIHKNGDFTLTMGGASPEVTLVLADVNLTGTTRIIHSYNGASRKVIVQGGSSSSANPLVYNTASSAGTMLVSKHYSRAAGGFLDGVVQKVASTDVDPVAPNILYLDKTLDSATTTTVVLTLTVPADQNAGSGVRIYIDALGRSAGAIQTYSGVAVANYSRVAASATNGSAGAMFNEAASGMSAAVVVALASGTTGDQTVTITVTVTHGLPTASSTTMLRARAEMTHWYTSAATLA